MVRLFLPHGRHSELSHLLELVHVPPSKKKIKNSAHQSSPIPSDSSLRSFARAEGGKSVARPIPP